MWLPAELRDHDTAAAKGQLIEWDALCGRLIRESLFGEGEPRPLRKVAEGVAAVAELLAVRLGLR